LALASPTLTVSFVTSLSPKPFFQKAACDDAQQQLLQQAAARGATLPIFSSASAFL
jgi:hypothetical protein